MPFERQTLHLSEKSDVNESSAVCVDDGVCAQNDVKETKLSIRCDAPSDAEFLAFVSNWCFVSVSMQFELFHSPKQKVEMFEYCHWLVWNDQLILKK